MPGIALPEEYTKENLELVEKGCENMVHHINTIRKAGINPVVCINRFYTDTDAECKVVRKAAEAAGARCAESKHWEMGGDGALEFADAVIDACNEENDFKFLYPLEMKLRDRVAISSPKKSTVPMACAWTPEAEAKAKMLESDPKYDDFATMMVKTHLSLTHDPTLKGVTQGLDPADPRRADLLGRQVPVPLRRYHQPDARNRLQPGLPTGGCGRQDRQSVGVVLGDDLKPLHLRRLGIFSRASLFVNYKIRSTKSEIRNKFKIRIL